MQVPKLPSSHVFISIFLSFLFQYSDVDTEEIDIDEISTFWRAMRENEQSETGRITRFTGFLEGYFRIELSDAWRRNKGIGFQEYSTLPVNRTFSDGSKLQFHLSNSDTYGYVDFYDAATVKKWRVEVATPVPYSVLGPHVLYADASIDKNRIYLIGQIGDFRFLRILSRVDGSLLAHFAFSCESNEFKLVHRMRDRPSQ